MAAGVIRVVFCLRLGFESSSQILSLSVPCSIVAILTRVAGSTACFAHFLSAMRSGIRAVTKVVLLASRFFSSWRQCTYSFVALCVPPGTLYAINMTSMGNPVLSAASALGAFLTPPRSMEITFLEEDSVTDFAVLPNSLDETTFRHPFGNLNRSPSAAKHVRIALAIEARDGLNTKDRAEHLTAGSDHLFEVMTATYHPLGICCWRGCRSPIQRPVGLPTV